MGQPRGYDWRIIRENPHEKNVGILGNGDVYIERGKGELDFGLENLGVEVADNIKYHDVEVNSELSEKEYFDSRYLEYFSAKNKVVAKSQIGRWTIGDYLEQRIVVDDSVAPELMVSSNFVKIGKNDDVGSAVKALVSGSDASQSFGYPLDTVLVGANNASRQTESNLYYDVWVSLVDVRSNESVQEYVEVKQSKNGTGIEELTTENKVVDLDILGNPVSDNTKFRVSTKDYLKNGRILISDVGGKVIDEFEINNLMPNEEREIGYPGFVGLLPGTYIVSFSGNGEKESRKMIKK